MENQDSEKELNFGSEVGFSTIPDQFRRKSIEEGFDLNMLVIGRRGLGTTTLVNSLFNAPLLERNRSNGIESSKNEIYENNIKLSLVITTYHGTDTNKIIDFIKEKNLEYFYNERGLKVSFADNRIHACLFLVPLDEIREEEIEMIKKVSKKCNFIPVIPKADTFTNEEMVIHKQNVLEKLKEHQICAYWPGCSESDEELRIEAQKLISKYPLSVAASENIYEHKGEYFRGRKYKWGFVNVCNPDISDFLDLRKMLVHSFLDDIIQQTEMVFYDAFRKKCESDTELCSRFESSLIEQVRLEALTIMNEEAATKSNNEISIDISPQQNEEIDAKE